MKKLIGLWAVLFMFYFAKAQSDTIRLPEVTVLGISNTSYSIGSKRQAVDSAQLQSQGTQSLSELLATQLPIHVRSYGNGMIGSISFRGTSANHTSILWNGLAINQATLGQADLSLVPMLAIDAVEVQYGSAGPQLGSDAMGGSILLSSMSAHDLKAWQAQFLTEQGSFGHQLYSAKVAWGNDRWQIRGRAFQSNSENNFEFANLTKAGFPREQQNNASFGYQGLTQDLRFKINNQISTSLHTWYHQSAREIQPSMAQNGNRGLFTVQADRSIRIMNSWLASTLTHGITEFKLAYLFDELVYNRSQNYQTYQYQLITDHEQRWNHRFRSRIGLRSNRIEVHADPYGFIPIEWRTDLYLTNYYQANEHWQFSLNFRQAWMDAQRAPLVPSIGMEWQWLRVANWTSRWKVLAGESYRLPTFNERYWPTGNLNILPESGRSIETGVEFNKSQNLGLEITAFHLLIDNWVLWQNSALGSTPFNLKQVRSNGLETSAFWKWNNTLLAMQIRAAYTYLQTINTQAQDQDDPSLGKQLIYVPPHKATVFGNMSFKKMYVNMHYTFVGHQFYTADNRDFIPSYQLVDVQFGNHIKFVQQRLDLSIKVNNLLNATYQPMRLMAMPGRNYRLSIAFQLNQLN